MSQVRSRDGGWRVERGVIVVFDGMVVIVVVGSMEYVCMCGDERWVVVVGSEVVHLLAPPSCLI